MTRSRIIEERWQFSQTTPMPHATLRVRFFPAVIWMVRSFITQRVSHNRQISLRRTTTLQARCFERGGRTRQFLIIEKSSSYARITQMPMQILEALFLQKAWSEKRLRSTGTPFESRLRMQPQGAIWHGCWRQLPTHRSEMDRRRSFWPNGLNLKALAVRIIPLFCGSLLRHTLRRAALLRLR